MSGVGDGGRAEFEVFVRSCLPGLLRYGRLLTSDVHAAEDLVQAALARTFASWGRIRVRDATEAYVRQAMLRELINHRTRRAWREQLTADLPDEARPADPDVTDRDAVLTALSRLPAGMRAVLVLRYYEDRSEQEIAELLGVSSGTVKSQASKGLARLRERGGLLEVPR